LHTGSDVLGYVRAGRPCSLAKCTALTGAATDAFILGMLDRIRYRFWLEVLHLCMGDFIPFRRRERPLVQALKRRLGLPAHFASQFVYRLPSSILGIVFYGLLLIASRYGGDHPDEDAADTYGDCRVHNRLIVSSLLIGAGSFFVSFFGFLPCFKFLLHSPGIRQLHQATRYYHSASRPPNLIYVTDGGVQDCTGILQLIRRKTPRILLVLAAEDPTDELTVLRTTMEAAAREKLASFYDPAEPRRDVRAALDDFQSSKELTYLHLGIRYGWGMVDESTHSTGHIMIIKNRLPPSWEGRPVMPLLTEEEIRSGKEPASEPGDLCQTDLGACCCDCCHTRGFNLCSKFPHYSNANQCLTPQMFNSLCRLGYEISADAVQVIANSELADRWEQHVVVPAVPSRSSRRFRQAGPEEGVQPGP